jgi:AraC-like DNA-binding protein
MLARMPASHTLAPAPGYPEEADSSVKVVVRLAELAARIERFAPHDGLHETPLPRLTLYRTCVTLPPSHTVYEPALCVLAQGRKHVLLGEERYVYDASNYLVVTQDLPMTGHVIEASPEAPYLSLRLTFDPAEIQELGRSLRLDHCEVEAARPTARGLFTGPICADLLDPVLRLVRLLDTPDDIATLGPLYSREILYRLMTSPEGWRLAQICQSEGRCKRIASAIAWLREHYAEPLRIESLARVAHMSPSSLHHHFKAVTAMSPLQYQKQLRLQEARRLLMTGSMDAATAGHRVGYESPSQFSREYSRLHGVPPARDLKRLRAERMALSWPDQADAGAA